MRSVWSYETAIQVWNFYDPRAGFIATSTLKETFSDQIVWIDVNADVGFKGLILYEGWNFVPLP